MTRRPRIAIVALTLGVACGPLAPFPPFRLTAQSAQAPPSTASSSTAWRGLTAGPQVAQVYGTILDARFDEVPNLLARTCGGDETPGQAASGGSPRPPAAARTSAARGGPRAASLERAPREACDLLAVVAIWWQIQLEPLDTSSDALFQARANATIDEMEAWVGREPQRAEAWFYLGGAYGARAQWRVLRGQSLSAARDGKRIKESLERALALDPELSDAYFGIGLYRYYADVAPAAAKLFRFLLALPGGDKAQGLRDMMRAREGGQLLRSEADYQLHVIYLWYEDQPQQALDLLTGLAVRYPHNPHFQQLAAEIHDVYLHDATASLRGWEALLTAARQRRVANAAETEVRARLGIAAEHDRLFESDKAIEELGALIASAPVVPPYALAQAQLQLAQALDRLGRRDKAEDAYGAVIVARTDARLGLTAKARAGLRERPDTETTTAYRLSLEGGRALERGAVDEAARLLAQSLTLRPADLVTRYRQARVLLAQKNDAAALAALDALIDAGGYKVAPSVYAAACMDAARLHEQRGARVRAIDLYRLVRTVDGADLRSKDAAQRALTRLGAAARASAR